mmetsp:Transcript_13088/g.20741  ORF Transcript_13088/g.20741 Transcript_13088/m.20741 type:complete len:348 (+) Transcript_13088:3-1046(+)
MAGLAYVYTSVFRKYAVGYELGKFALSLNKSPKMVGDLSLTVTCSVCTFKEPIQALLPLILENRETALKYGKMTNACVLSSAYIVRSFLSGSELASVDKEMTVFLHQMARYMRSGWNLALIPVSNIIANLSGGEQRRLCDGAQGYEDNEHNLNKAFEKKDIMRCDIIVTIKMMENFVFRTIDQAKVLVQKYQTFFDRHDRNLVQFSTIHRTFYSGLTAFHSFRETQNQYWMDIGVRAMEEMGTWAREGCKWNFENKFLILNAEYHFCVGDFDTAAEQYELAIASSHNHRFMHEEAIANELAAHFQSERGMKDISIGLLQQAMRCYESWGAQKKVAKLARSLNNSICV